MPISTLFNKPILNPHSTNQPNIPLMHHFNTNNHNKGINQTLFHQESTIPPSKHQNPKNDLSNIKPLQIRFAFH
jgi:hypothetical protein